MLQPNDKQLLSPVTDRDYFISINGLDDAGCIFLYFHSNWINVSVWFFLLLDIFALT
jgi:hypothetical protein